jgi:hypothetical protein
MHFSKKINYKINDAEVDLEIIRRKKKQEAAPNSYYNGFGAIGLMEELVLLRDLANPKQR